jgi:hypothetical protein
MASMTFNGKERKIVNIGNGLLVDLVPCRSSGKSVYIIFVVVFVAAVTIKVIVTKKISC